MAGLTKKPRMPAWWQQGLIAGGGLAAFLYMNKPYWDQYWREKADNLANKKTDM